MLSSGLDGDRLATIDMSRKWGGELHPFWAQLGPHLTQSGLGHTQWQLDPSSRLATIDMGRKVGALPLFRGELGPHLTQCRLGRGLPHYQVASLSIQPFGQYRYPPKIGGALFWGGSCVPI